MQLFLSNAKGDVPDMLAAIESEIKRELKESYPEITVSTDRPLNLILDDIYRNYKNSTEITNGFIFIIDEWDCILREKQNDAEGIKIYLDYLRALLKDQSYVALAYMPGILPIKKYGSHSALNMFDEYSMAEPG